MLDFAGVIFLYMAIIRIAWGAFFALFIIGKEYDHQNSVSSQLCQSKDPNILDVSFWYSKQTNNRSRIDDLYIY